LFNQISLVSNQQGKNLPTTRYAAFIISLLIWVGLSVSSSLWPRQALVQASAGARKEAQSAQETDSLEPGKPIERELSGGQSHSYKIAMISGQYLQVVVDQRGIDVAVVLLAPDGKMISEVDSERLVERSETVSTIAEVPGAYLIEARSAEKTAKAGRYVIKVEELRSATAEDKYRVTGEAIFREAEQLKDGTLEARRKSVEKYHEALELYRRAGTRSGEAVTLNRIGEVYWGLGETQKALEKFNEALPISRAIGVRKVEAVTLKNIGMVYQSMGETRKALEKFNEALPIFQAVGDRSGEASALSYIGLAYWSLGETRKALEKHNEALPIFQAAGARRDEAMALSNIGATHWSLREMQKALEKYNEALSLSRTLGDRRLEAAILTNIGAVYDSLGEIQKALEKFNESLPIRWAVGDRLGEAVTLHNIGTSYRSLGEIQKALEKFNEALLICQALGDRSGEASAVSNIGEVYWSLGETRKALEKYNKALPILQSIGDRSWEAITLKNIGMAYQSLGETRKALEMYNEALLIFQAVGDRMAEASALSNIGTVYRSLGETRKALEKYNEALPILQAVGARRVEAITLNNIGLIYQLLGETRKALEKYNEALLLRRAVDDRNGQADTLLGIARVEQKRGNLTQAHQLIEQAIGLIESLRTNIPNQELRSSYFANRQEFFEFYIDVLMQMHKQNPAAVLDAAALAVSERARARSLLELLKESRANIRQGVDTSLLDRERSLQQRLNAKAAVQSRLLNRKHTLEQAEAAAKEIAAITTEYEEVQAQIRARSPRYAALTQPQPLGLTEIQQQALDEDTLLLEYALGKERSYLWLVSHRSIDSYELPPRAEVEAATRQVYKLLTARPKRWTPPDPQFIAQAKALSGMLLGPVAPRLGGKRLVVVAPGALSYLPFGSLPAPEDEKRPAGGYEPLIAKHEVVSVPSASVLSLIRREMAGRQRAAKSIAVLADPVFEASDPRLESAKTVNSPGEPLAAPAGDAEDSELTRAIRTMNFSDARAGYTRLAFSRQEAESIFALTPKGTGLKATDFNASRDLALSRELSQYRILHFATHGLLNSERPELSGLVFSLVDQKGKPQDGFLRLHEIYNLQLNADLVVLSACETGLGKEIKGEGLIGLTRGFMYSGAPRVVASLWNVDDLATAELMKLFYQRMLKDGLPPGAALRAAQLELSRQKRWASPYFWAGFVLHGEWK
jgi:CHAT domain-containing protein/predicted negative regulator of RcsB-dependent stress response